MGFTERPGSASTLGVGAAAAATVGHAAAVVAEVARSACGSWSDAGGIAAQARSRQQRCAELASEGAAAFAEALEALGALDGGGRAGAVLDRAAGFPLAVAEAAADVAELAAETAGRCSGNHHADAVGAALLAHGAARAAAHLVAVNLAVQTGDERLSRAQRAVEAAGDAARRALDT